MLLILRSTSQLSQKNLKSLERLVYASQQNRQVLLTVFDSDQIVALAINDFKAATITQIIN